jgi:hypothetical protein
MRGGTLQHELLVKRVPIYRVVLDQLLPACFLNLFFPRSVSLCCLPLPQTRPGAMHPSSVIFGPEKCVFLPLLSWSNTASAQLALRPETLKPTPSEVSDYGDASQSLRLESHQRTVSDSEKGRAKASRLLAGGSKQVCFHIFNVAALFLSS